MIKLPIFFLRVYCYRLLYAKTINYVNRRDVFLKVKPQKNTPTFYTSVNSVLLHLGHGEDIDRKIELILDRQVKLIHL